MFFQAGQLKFLAYLWDFHVISAVIVPLFLERFSNCYLKQFFDRWKTFCALTCCHSAVPFTKNELVLCYQPYRVFSHDVTAVILVFQNNKTAAMLVFQTNPVGLELFSYVNASFFPINLHRCRPREWKRYISSVPSVGTDIEHVQQDKQYNQTIKAPGELYCLDPCFFCDDSTCRKTHFPCSFITISRLFHTTIKSRNSWTTMLGPVYMEVGTPSRWVNMWRVTPPVM